MSDWQDIFGHWGRTTAPMDGDPDYMVKLNRKHRDELARRQADAEMNSVKRERDDKLD